MQYCYPTEALQPELSGTESTHGPCSGLSEEGEFHPCFLELRRWRSPTWESGNSATSSTEPSAW